MNEKTHNDPDHIIGAKEVEELKKQGWKYAGGGLQNPISMTIEPDSRAKGAKAAKGKCL